MPASSFEQGPADTAALLVVGMVSARTVNLSHIASERPGTVQVASTYCRLQRFLQHVELSPDWSAPVVAGLLGLDGCWTLALDRTQWRVGERDGNSSCWPPSRRASGCR